jgi:hypothetical protein
VERRTNTSGVGRRLLHHFSSSRTDEKRARKELAVLLLVEPRTFDVEQAQAREAGAATCALDHRISEMKSPLSPGPQGCLWPRPRSMKSSRGCAVAGCSTEKVERHMARLTRFVPRDRKPRGFKPCAADVRPPPPCPNTNGSARLHALCI